MVNRGKVAAGKRRRAQVLLKADAGEEGSGLTDGQVAEALDVSQTTVHNIRKAHVEGEPAKAIEFQKGVRQRPPKLDGEQEAN